ncbi:RIP metalloprotease RseP [Parabacteroides sp. FAFU027]|uniref:RIP metalloprotease RseP n=1 Tax=Parabacteroides sp. FAFU027 TaxID=2922715 RepID=UPI001FAF14A3|nr:RIP metalloprotease RseP [Parabacteroides sp. FAFU027]
MESFLIKALQLICSLSILVIVHEFGHFIFARIFKVRVEKFYLFFNPWFSLFKFKPKNSETEYGVGWLPLGGYVKIAGMIDESMDKEQMALPAQPFEFRSKPAGQRLMIMVAGVVMNFLLAIFLYAMISFTWGDKYVPLKNARLGMEFSETAQRIGFHDGDILLSTDKKELERFDADILSDISKAKQVNVLRNGQVVSVAIPADFMQQLLRDKKGFALMRIPMVVKRIMSGKPAEKAGIQERDSITSVNGVKTVTAFAAMDALYKNQNKPIKLGFYRNGKEHQVIITPDSKGKIGIELMAETDIYSPKIKSYGFFESIPAGINKGVGKLTGYASSMKYVFTKEGASSLGGFGTLGSIFPSQWNWLGFWEITAFLSVILAFMNILPIPALDGGHVLFLLYEVITGRKPSDKFLEYAQIAGMVLLFSLLIYANGNDLFRFFAK